jgi:hypothetical protein
MDEDYYDFEDEDSSEDDLQETPRPRKSHKKDGKRPKNLKERREIKMEEEYDDYDDEEASESRKRKKSDQISARKKQKKKRSTKQELEEFAGEEENNGRKISWNLKNWNFKKKNKKKFNKKRKKKKRDYENNNQQFNKELNGGPDDEYRIFQRGGQGVPRSDWRNEIVGGEADGKAYASSEKNSEIIMDPVVDSSKFKASSLEIDIQPTMDLAHKEKNSKGIRVVEWPRPILEIKTPPQMILSKNTDNKLKKISEEVSRQKQPDAEAREALWLAERSGTPNAGKRRRHKATPRESIKLRQELETYRQMYAENFDEAKPTLEKKGEVDANV